MKNQYTLGFLIRRDKIRIENFFMIIHQNVSLTYNLF